MDAPEHSADSPSDARAKRELQVDEIANAETLEDIGDDTAERLGRPPTRELFDDPDALGEFELVGRLGSGGYGEVVRATDLRLERDVAIKIVKQERAGDASQRKRFLEEARSVAKLRHPNIVPVHQVGEIESGIPFIVYEFIDGPTLRKRVWKKKQFSPDEAVALLVKIADGLGYAHELGIVHRDVKPANILIDRKTGEPHLADFGCASTIDIGQPAEETDDRPYVGTLAYFSPEQAAGLSHRADARTDVWALGVVMDEMLTGKRYRADLDDIFEGNSDDLPTYLNRLQTYRPSPLRERVPSVDADLNAIWEKCVAVDANQRYDNASELAEEFRRWQRREPVLARPIGLREGVVRWARRNPQVAGSLAAVFGTILLASLIMLLFNRELRSANREIIASAVNDIVDVDASGLPNAVQRINSESYRDVAADILQQRWQSAFETNLSSHDVRRLSLGLTALGVRADEPDGVVDQLVNSSTSEEELRAGCDALRSTDTELDWMYQGLRKKLYESEPASQLRALCSLALLSQLGEETETASERASNWLFELESRNDGLEWVPLAREQFPGLKVRLEALGEKHKSNEANRRVVERLLVAASDNHVDLLKQLVSGEKPIGDILPKLKQHVDELDTPLSFPEFARLAFGDSTMSDLSLLSDPSSNAWLWIAYLYCADFERDLDQLDKHLLRPMNPESGVPDFQVQDRTALTVFISQLQASEIPWQKPLRLCDVWHASKDPRLKEMLLAVGGYPAPANIPSRKKELLQDIWITSLDSGTHGASEWLMRKWGVERDNRQLPSEYSVDRNWRFSDGLLFVRVTCPSEPIQIGTPSKQLAQFIQPPPQWSGDPAEYIDGRNDPTDERYEVAHPHRFVGDFEMSAYEITEAQFNRFANDEQLVELGGNVRTETRRMTRGNDEHPASRLSWYDAVEYCVWKSLKEDKPSCYGEADSAVAFAKIVATAFKSETVLPCDRAVNGYRLPTSAEWEYACRSGSLTPWHFGRDGDYIEVFANCARSRTTGEFEAPGLRRPNAWGLFDMLGNISEWTDSPCLQLPADVLAEDEVRRIPNPAGTILGFDVRGGDSKSKAADARSARREANHIGRPESGIRLVRTLP